MGFCLSRRVLPLKLGRENKQIHQKHLWCVYCILAFSRIFPRKKVWIAKYQIPTIARIFSGVPKLSEGLHNLLHPCILDARKWRENEKTERDSLSTFPHFLFISSFSIHFLYQKLSHFVAKCLIRHLCRECHKKPYLIIVIFFTLTQFLWE